MSIHDLLHYVMLIWKRLSPVHRQKALFGHMILWIFRFLTGVGRRDLAKCRFCCCSTNLHKVSTGFHAGSLFKPVPLDFFDENAIDLGSGDQAPDKDLCVHCDAN